MRLKKAGILTKIIIIALVVYAVWSLVRLRGQIVTKSEELSVKQEEAQALENSNDDKQYAIDHKDDDETIKEVARDKLGLAEYDEKVFYAK